MTVGPIIEFVQYLNENGYSISPDKISRFFEILSNEDDMYVETNELLSLMKSTFCSSKEEVLVLPEHFDYFLKRHEELMKNSMIEEDKKKNTKQYQETKKSLEDEIDDIVKEAQKFKENFRKSNASKATTLLTKNEMKQLNDNKALIKKIKFPKKEDNEFFQDVLKNEGYLVGSYDANVSKEVMDALVKKSEEFLKKGNLAGFEICNLLFKMVSKAHKKDNLAQNKNEKELEEGLKVFKDKEEQIKNEINRLSMEHTRVQNELNSKLVNSKKPQVINKSQSIHNRDEYIGGHNYVRTYNEDVGNAMDKNFKNLTKEEQNLVYSYIKKNLLSFKTKMNRNIYSTNKLKLDMQRTIQNACKTNGLPLELFYEEKKRGKTDLILLLDVSGSCKEASKMMLTFMYLLQDVFHRGCKTFAFIDSLYDISKIMDTKDIDTSIDNVLKAIPAKGAYSNYYKPLETLWVGNKKIISKDSIVIFMGDCRNNKNKPGLEYLKNISRKAKSCYWLNTEKFKKWGQGDSLALEYAKYAKMYEVLNTNDLIYFINNFK